MLRAGKLVTNSMDRRFEVWSAPSCARGCAVLIACVGAALALGATALFAGSAPSFAPARSYTTGRWPHQVAIGDLNGDGKRDLATANYDANTVSLLLNRGDGSLRAKRDYRAGRHPSSVAIADLTGDGERDLAIANAEASVVSVLLNRGDGRLRAKRDYATARSPFAVAIGDLSGDGKPDLVTANSEADNVSVLLNRATATSRQRSTTQPDASLPRSRSAS
jgi:hypothetical protein